MSVVKKINLYLADSTKQVDEYIAQDYTDEELIAKFRRNPTDDVLWNEIMFRELNDDPVVSALAGEKLLQVARGSDAGETNPPEGNNLTFDTGDGEDEDAEYAEGDGMMEGLKRGKALKGNYSERKLPKGAKLINATQAYVIGNPYEKGDPEWMADTVTVFEKGKGKGWQPWWTMSKRDFQLEFGIKVNEAKGTSTPMQCMECGKRFKKKIGKNTFEVKCPKCGGYDTEPA
jgi:hypothetical protein